MVTYESDNNLESTSSDWVLVELTGPNVILGSIFREVNLAISLWTKPKELENHADLIADGLWLGNSFASQDQEFIFDKEIGCVLNVCLDPNLLVAKSSSFYYHLPMEDSYGCDQSYLPELNAGADLVHEKISKGITILVHCKRGHHRSAAVISMYLMKYRGMGLTESIVFIKKSRPSSFRKITCILENLISYEYSVKK